ncbi:MULTISPECIES: 16S rRNA (cytidine(1402)-2'-O)-methyltransferase [Thiomonas]|uniref:Ribosomal RNA small subunit methyltransferase I n=1 Tax=Thiomonas delicata TaxID=364030 RepID=A0A238D416_THIDL|nr:MULTISPECIES: 16S rRNA (cytidine(1402)-2'-O)-methyltransferase [Thiomonas]SBP87961.1 putative methyltransferase [Thiomonas delicata]
MSTPPSERSHDPLAAARQLCAGQQLPPGCLLVVATPIGNLADISLRALAMLERCDLVAAEDTRMAQRLLQAYGLSKPLLRADRHREQAAAADMLGHLAAGRRVAYVSDAGTPGINDPGAVLVRAAREAGHPVLPLPGASSVTAALSASGLELETGYTFAGYVPATKQQRLAFYREQLASHRAVVCFETPHRIQQSLDDLAALAAASPAPVRMLLAKELTKQFETIAAGTPAELLAWLAADPKRAQGEFVLVLQPPAGADAQAMDGRTQRWLLRLARELPASRAAAVAADMLGADRKTLYRWLLAQTNAQPRED